MDKNSESFPSAEGRMPVGYDRITTTFKREWLAEIHCGQQLFTLHSDSELQSIALLFELFERQTSEAAK